MQNPNVSQVASFNKWKTDFEQLKGFKSSDLGSLPSNKHPCSSKKVRLYSAENEMEQKKSPLL